MKKFTEEQLEAINYVGSDILVSASAGSGKTAVLVNRVIKKVLEEHVDIDKLVIVTFTKASAKELKQRIILAIKEKLKETNNETNKKNNEFLKKQLSNISRAYITTIHSFCLDLIKKNFYNLGLDPSIKIIDDNNISIYKQSCIDNIIEDNIDNIYNLLTLFNFKEDELKIYILNIYNYILSHDDYMNYLKSVIEKYNVDVNKDVSEFDFGKYIMDDIYMRLNLLKSNLEYYQDKMSCEEYFDKYIDITEYDINIVNNLINCKRYDDMYNCLNCIENKSLPGGKSKIVNIQLKEDFKSFRNNIYKKEIEYIKSVVYEKSFKVLSDLKVSYNYLIEIYNLVEMLDTEYSKIKRDNCVIDYSDIEHFALKVLNENDLSNDFYEVYIDEYQDSSLIQEKILSKISNNNRFMVGDIKQSIYKFRLAMPEIFKSKYMSKNNKTVLLAKNFRSRKEVLSSINYIFSSIMTSEIGDSEYLSNEILIHGNKEYIASDCNYGMEINIIDSKINIDDNEIVKEYILELKSFEIESIYIAKRINELISSKFKVMGKNSLRDIQYKDIVVLLRNMKDKCNILEDTLNKNNIPVFTDNSSNVFNKNETILILSLLKIINNPYIDIELVSVMYSIIGKFSLDEIYTIKNNSKEYMYNLLLKSDNNKCKLFVQLIENFRKYNTFHSISELINKIYMDTEIYNELSLNINSKISKLSLEALVSSATNFNNIYDFVNYIESLNEKSDNSLAKLIGEDEDVVRIMSIHKSKGLEFPIVILASSATKYNQRDLSNAILLNSDFGIGINTIDNNISYPTVIKQGIKSKILKDIKSEELRMLYVALTRAKEKIIVFASINDFDKKYSNLYIKYNNNKIDKSIILKNNSYIQNILYGIDKFLKNATNSKLFELNKIYINDDIIDNNESIDYIDKLNETNFNVDNEVDLIEENLKSKYILDNVNKKVSVSNLKNSKIDVSFKKLNDNITPKRKGTLIHFILEHLDIKSVTSIEYLNNYLDEQVVLNIISSEERDVIDTNKIYNFILSKIGKEIINSTQVKKEVEFILNDSIYSSSSIQGVIDMYYLNSDNTYTLIDFKTDNIFSEDKFREYYSLQLNIYKEAIYKLTNISVKNTYIYSFSLEREIKM